MGHHPPPATPATAPADCEVRRVRPGEADALVDLHERALAAAGSDPADVPGTRDLRWIEAAYLEHGGEFVVAERRSEAAGGTPDVGGVDPEIVAMGGLVVDGAVGELFRMAVDPDAQREGYGSAVLAALEVAGRRRGVTRLRLSTASRQSAALAFYAANGYRETGRSRYGAYELVAFEKRLDD